FSRTSRGAVRKFKPTRTISMLREALLKILVVLRKIEIHDRKAEHDKNKVKNTQERSAGASPNRGTRQLEIDRVENYHDNGDDVLGVEEPVLACLAIHSDKTEHGADRDRDQAHQDARVAHAFEKFQGRQPPNDISQLAHAEETFFREKHDAKDTRKGESGIG